jgi:hypothetical protein
MFIGLVRDPGWNGPPDGLPERPDREPRSWRIPWRPIVWTATLLALIALVPLADHLLGALAGYLLILLVVSVAAVRFDRWCSRQYWRGLKDYQA